MKAFSAMLAAALATSVSAATAAVSPDYPLIPDVDVRQVCSQPSKGKLTIFNPSGGQVEWRLRHNGTAISTPLQVTLTGTLTGTFTAPPGGEFRWHFGDGTSAVTTTPQVTHTYTTTGPHLPRVVVDGRLHEARDSVRVPAGT